MSDEVFPIETIKGCDIGCFTPNRATRAQSGARQVVNYGGGYWTFAVELGSRTRNVHDQVDAFLNARQGSFDTFKLILPYYSWTKTGYTGVIQVAGAGQTGYSINVDGLTPLTRVLMAGDYVRFDGHNKVYQVVKDVVSDGAGLGVMQLNMPVVAIPNDNADVIINGVDFTVFNAEDKVVKGIGLTQRVEWSLNFEEQWN